MFFFLLILLFASFSDPIQMCKKKKLTIIIDRYFAVSQSTVATGAGAVSAAREECVLAANRAGSQLYIDWIDCPQPES